MSKIIKTLAATASIAALAGTTNAATPKRRKSAEGKTDNAHFTA